MAAFRRADEEEPDLMPHDLRICFLGDSLVAGVGDPDHLGWVGRLSARTHHTGRSLTAYNLGVRGQTGPDILDRWHDECRPRLPWGCDGRIVVSFGANDTAMDGKRTRATPQQSTDALRQLLSAARLAGWSVLVVGPPPVADEQHRGRTADLDRLLREVCDSEGVGHVSVVDALAAEPAYLREVVANDGSHPGAAGYALLTELIWPSWDAWLRESGPEA